MWYINEHTWHFFNKTTILRTLQGLDPSQGQGLTSLSFRLIYYCATHAISYLPPIPNFLSRRYPRSPWHRSDGPAHKVSDDGRTEVCPSGRCSVHHAPDVLWWSAPLRCLALIPEDRQLGTYRANKQCQWRWTETKAIFVL